jgi:hypothetical protein
LPEPQPSPAEVAAEDQNLAGARHASSVARRYWNGLVGDGDGEAVPSEVAALLIEQWHAWWVDSDGPDLDLDDDD